MESYIDGVLGNEIELRAAIDPLILSYVFVRPVNAELIFYLLFCYEEFDRDMHS